MNSEFYRGLIRDTFDLLNPVVTGHSLTPEYHIDWCNINMQINRLNRNKLLRFQWEFCQCLNYRIRYHFITQMNCTFK